MHSNKQPISKKKFIVAGILLGLISLVQGAPHYQGQTKSNIMAALEGKNKAILSNGYRGSRVNQMRPKFLLQTSEDGEETGAVEVTDAPVDPVLIADPVAVEPASDVVSPATDAESVAAPSGTAEVQVETASTDAQAPEEPAAVESAEPIADAPVVGFTSEVEQA